MIDTIIESLREKYEGMKSRGEILDYKIITEDGNYSSVKVNITPIPAADYIELKCRMGGLADEEPKEDK